MRCFLMVAYYSSVSSSTLTKVRTSLIFQHSPMFLGKDGAIKSDEFSEKSQTGFDPPSFTDHYVAKFV